ncbi:hypothetical protein ABXY50_005335 [Escherichia coli]
MLDIDARVIVRLAIKYCEDILQSKKRFTQNFQNEMRNTLIYCIDVIHEDREYFLTFKNRGYKELGQDCYNKNDCVTDYTRYRINGPLPENWRPTKSPSRSAGYFFCDGHQPYYSRKDMKNYIACLYELLDLLNSL